MKKIITGLALGLVLGAATIINTFGASSSLTIQGNQFTNFPLTYPGAIKLTQVIVTASATNNVNLQFIDAPTNSLTYTNAAYPVLTTVITNFVTTWTNYQGVTNNVTNIYIQDVASTNAAQTNSYPIRFQTAVNTNNTVTYQGVNYYFNQGLWVTNITTNSAVITITYQQ